MRTSETERFTRFCNLYEGICTLQTPIEGKIAESVRNFLPLKGMQHTARGVESALTHLIQGFLPMESAGKKSSDFFADSSSGLARGYAE